MSPFFGPLHARRLHPDHNGRAHSHPRRRPSATLLIAGVLGAAACGGGSGMANGGADSGASTTGGAGGTGEPVGSGGSSHGGAVSRNSGGQANLDGGGAGRGPIPLASKPNIIYILADDLGYGDLGAYDQKDILTPRLDQMAAEGMRFTDHYASSTVCMPSRCQLLTGLHSGHSFARTNMEVAPVPPDTGKGYQEALPDENITIAELLKAGGYRTGVVGKWGLGGPGTEGAPNRQGFDFFYGYLGQKQAHSYYPDHLWRNDQKEQLAAGTYSHDLLTEEILAFIDRNKAGPFLMYAAYTIPHSAIEIPEIHPDYVGKFADPDPARQINKQTFASMITRLDRDVGRIIDRVTQHGLAARTLIMFTSDNGPHKAGGHLLEDFDSSGGLRGYKRFLHEGGIRVPLIAHWPGTVAPGSESSHISYFPDMMPTFCELAGVACPQGHDGISMLPALTGKQQPAHPYLYWEFPMDEQVAVRAGEWKLYSNRKMAAPALYNLTADIAETTDVAAQHPEKLAELQGYAAAAHSDTPLVLEMP